MAEKGTSFFVAVEDPIELRRHILETARGSIQTLQLYEKLRGIRADKAKSIAQLKTDLKGVTRLLSKLKSALPKANLRIKMHEHEKMPGAYTQSKKKSGKKVRVEVLPARSELEKLEAELSAIEGKLGSLE